MMRREEKASESGDIREWEEPQPLTSLRHSRKGCTPRLG